ncbi:MAG TPA: hypothetical protein VF681_04575, partial [Abditibacteriaceae bacterium]
LCVLASGLLDRFLGLCSISLPESNRKRARFGACPISPDPKLEPIAYADSHHREDRHYETEFRQQLHFSTPETAPNCGVPTL